VRGAGPGTAHTFAGLLTNSMASTDDWARFRTLDAYGQLTGFVPRPKDLGKIDLMPDTLGGVRTYT